MIGTLPMRSLAPLDYRYALDAALTLLGAEPPLVCCDVPELTAEIVQRLPQRAPSSARAGLWVEPQHNNWQQQLRDFTHALCVGTTLVIIASRSLARLVPERRGWRSDPLGLRLGGLAALHRALTRARFHVAQSYGIHTLSAIAISLIGQQCDRLGWPDLGDRLHFAARLRYCTASPIRSLSTVALLVARNEAGPC